LEGRVEPIVELMPVRVAEMSTRDFFFCFGMRLETNYCGKHINMMNVRN